jgi:hypothetical protein
MINGAPAPTARAIMLGRNGDAVGVLLALIGKVEYKVGARKRADRRG